MMKLLSPLNETCNVKELSRYADEYYLGVCDEEWRSISQRNLMPGDSVKEVIFRDGKP